MKKINIVILSLLVSLLFVACQTAEETSSEPIKYTLTTTTGKTISFEASNTKFISKNIKNKMVLLNFWATWCKPCVKEMPTFVSLQEKYKDDFIIIGVLHEKQYDQEVLDKFLKKFNVNFPITIGAENFVLSEMIDNVQMVPESFLYDKNGAIVEKFVGEINKDKLESYIHQNYAIEKSN